MCNGLSPSASHWLDLSLSPGPYIPKKRAIPLFVIARSPFDRLRSDDAIHSVGSQWIAASLLSLSKGPSQ